MDRRTVHSLSRAPVVLIALLGVALLGFATGCTGSPASTSAWQGTSDRTIGTLIAALGTARIVVREVAQDDVQQSYAVVTVTDVIETSSKELSGYQVGQPPDRLHRAHDEVVRTLQGALALLVEVRVEIGSPGLTADAARRLLHEIDVARDRLDDLDRAVMSSPAAVGAG
jgi:hypothetical protein